MQNKTFLQFDFWKVWCVFFFNAPLRLQGELDKLLSLLQWYSNPPEKVYAPCCPHGELLCNTDTNGQV